MRSCQYNNIVLKVQYAINSSHIRKGVRGLYSGQSHKAALMLPNWYVDVSLTPYAMPRNQVTVHFTANSVTKQTVK